MGLGDKIVKLAEKIKGDKPLSVGVVGYSRDLTLGQKDFTRKTLLNIFADLDSIHNLEIVSGYTRVGVPAIAYDVANELGMKTVGISCAKCKEFDTYPVDEVIIVGENWGDESETFIKRIDFLIRIGGGEQSHNEVKMFKETSKYEPQKLQEFKM